MDMCNGCQLSMVQVHEIIQNETKLLEFLHVHGVLNVNPVVCPKWNQPCKFYLSDNVLFSCTNRVGGSKKKLFGVFLELWPKGGHFLKKAHLPLDTIFKFVSYWPALKPKQKWLEDEVNIAPDTVVNWSNFCREVCFNLPS